MQGSKEWHAFRAKHYTAGDAASQMGHSPYKTRNKLLGEKATGIYDEVEFFQQRIFDKGHEFERLALPLAEEIIGEELYPVVGSEGIIAASFDGLTFSESIGVEHKMLNNVIRECQDAGDLPMHYRIQMEQQLYVSGAEKWLFLATNWDGDTLLEKKYFWYYPDFVLRNQIIDGWEQFEKDLQSYTYVEPKIEVVGRSPESLPALRLELSGAVTASNLIEFKVHALGVLSGIKTALETDDDFANADKATKWCKEVETRLDAAKQHALSQTQSIDEVFRVIDEIREETRNKRLTLEKLVKQQKEAIRFKKVELVKKEFDNHYNSLQKQIDDYSQFDIRLNIVMPDFGAEIKGLKSISSIQNALDTSLAREKINANNDLKDLLEKVSAFKDATSDVKHSLLFPDLSQIIQKPIDDFLLVVQHRVEQSKVVKEQIILEAQKPEQKVLFKEGKNQEVDSRKQLIDLFMSEHEFGVNKSLIQDTLIDFCHFLKDQKIFN